MISTKILKRTIDVLMLVVLVTLMAYQFLGEVYHELAGILMFILFLLHNALNFKWYTVLFKGRYTVYRTLSTVINLLLLFIMISVMASGIMISKHIFSSFSIVNGISIARSIHISAGYWGLVLMSFHAGLHMGLFIKPDSKSIIPLTIIAVFGVYNFIKLKIWSYMLLINRFVYYDNSKFIYILKFASIIILFITIGYIISDMIKNKKI